MISISRWISRYRVYDNNIYVYPGIGWSPERHTKSLVYLGGGYEGEEDANSEVTSQVISMKL